MRKKTRNTPQKIEAVFDEDLEGVLKDLGLYDEVAGGGFRCAFCGEVVTLDNLQFIFSDGDAIRISCDKPSCIEEFSLRGTQSEH